MNNIEGKGLNQSFRRPDESLLGTLDTEKIVESPDEILTKAQNLGLEITGIMAQIDSGGDVSKEIRETLVLQVKEMRKELSESESTYHDFDQKRIAVDLINSFARFEERFENPVQ